jgi:succinate-acetate transporter protein
MSELESVGRNVRDGRRDPPVTIMLRPLASPLPIGFFAFAIGSFLFSALELGWIAHTQAPELAIIMVVFVAPIELLACVLAFWARDNGGATALGLFGMTWATVGAILLTSPTARSAMLGWFLLCMAAVILAFAVTSAFGKPVLSIVSGISCARFAITGIYQINGGLRWEHASGWLGLPMSAAAFYLALALMLEDTQRQTVLPLGRRGAARSALESHLRDQVEAIEREAGVRRQL